MMYDDPLGLSLPPATGAVGRIKGWVRDAWHLGEDVGIMVCEARCQDAACPTAETVVIVEYNEQLTVERRFPKGLAELVRADVFDLPPPEPWTATR